MIKHTIGLTFIVLFALFTSHAFSKTKPHGIKPLNIIAPKGEWSNCYIRKLEHDDKNNSVNIYVLGSRCFIKRRGKPKTLPKFPSKSKTAKSIVLKKKVK